MIILCFDYGIKIIGIAIAETKLNYSTPIKSIFNNKKKNFWNQINIIINMWKPKYIVIGYPYKIKKKINKKIKKFAKEIKKKFKINFFLCDENYSTTEALLFLKEKKKKKKYCLHSISAKIILDSWIRKNI
ncbi:Holliday junction resolvase RuvX [Buchnera aphidicola]|uniref:Putative pre-16S rRNA nuclease n=1 Tax=Buchnera aphidicola subsp. Cinara cedri (strain Cc) TaxID=372461 RepID=YQGF_BUCCC|nr:Holliday junction resolvase RuvX [Buchnera aphidicola]Q056Y6.1 RecName: Full=Putative pre-16S rRNA nuclease [Buchnera aphidicola BCc]ABJ90813.1 putative Holliday jonction resolvase [Buchnera aphidicola BCc]